MFPVEVLDENEKVVARGKIDYDAVKRLGLAINPDNTIRIQDLAWKTMNTHRKNVFLYTLNAWEV